MGKREWTPRTATSDGSFLDAKEVQGADPNGNRAQRRKAAKLRRHTEKKERNDRRD